MQLASIAIWFIGIIVGNVLMDVMTVIRIATVTPTAFGILMAIVYVPYLYVPKPHKIFNIYFSILFSWVTAAIAFVMIIILFLVKNANNSNKTHLQ